MIKEVDPVGFCVLVVDPERPDTGYFVSEATVYRLLKAHDPITSPALIVIKASSEFTDKTTRPVEIWQTDLAYFKIIGWGWMYPGHLQKISGVTVAEMIQWA